MREQLHTIGRMALGRLRERGYESYGAYLASPEWATIKARYRASKLSKVCAVCRNPDYELHHRSYKRVGGEEWLQDLVPLCREHHEAIHTFHRSRENAKPHTLYRNTRVGVNKERKRSRYAQPLNASQTCALDELRRQGGKANTRQIAASLGLNVKAIGYEMVRLRQRGWVKRQGKTWIALPGRVVQPF